jgi:hypothetical protein
LLPDTQNRQYLTSKVNCLFSFKLDFMRTSGDKKERLPIKNDEESSLVAEGALNMACLFYIHTLQLIT